MLKDGKKLSEITDYFVKKYSIPIRKYPASSMIIMKPASSPRTTRKYTYRSFG